MQAGAIIFPMPNLSVRGLDEHSYSALRVRAAQHNHSMEEEARQIIRTAVSAPERLGDRFLTYFGSKVGVDLDLPRRPAHDPPKLVP